MSSKQAHRGFCVTKKKNVFKDYADIKKEVDNMVSSTLELKSIKMRDEAVNEAVKEAVKKTVARTVSEITKNTKEKLEMLGLPEEQIQEVLEYVTKKTEEQCLVNKGK